MGIKLRILKQNIKNGIKNNRDILRHAIKPFTTQTSVKTPEVFERLGQTSLAPRTNPVNRTKPINVKRRR